MARYKKGPDNKYIEFRDLDVSNITDLFGTFRFLKDFNQDISHWDVSNVTNMSLLFASAERFNQDISAWDVSNVTDMAYMFYFATKFNQDISNWNISNVEGMYNIFFSVNSFKQYLGDWKFNKNCIKPSINRLSFEDNNFAYKFSEKRLNKFIQNFITDKSDVNKYELIKYCKQYKEFDPKGFESIIQGLSNIDNLISLN